MAYKRLLELAEDGNVDQLLNSFIEKEQKSFACFVYVSELNDDMQKMQRKIKELQVCSGFFMSPLSARVFWAGLGVSCPMCPASLPTPEPCSQPATRVGLRECKEIAKHTTSINRTLCSRS